MLIYGTADLTSYRREFGSLRVGRLVVVRTIGNYHTKRVTKPYNGGT